MPGDREGPGASRQASRGLLAWGRSLRTLGPSSSALAVPPGSGSETRQPCTDKRDTVCSCRPGTQPQDGFKRGSGRRGLRDPGRSACPRPTQSPPPRALPRPGLEPCGGQGLGLWGRPGWPAGWEGLPEAAGWGAPSPRPRHAAPTGAEPAPLSLQTVPRARQDTSPRATTRPASPGPSECPGGRAAEAGGALLGPAPHDGPGPCPGSTWGACETAARARECVRPSVPGGLPVGRGSGVKAQVGEGKSQREEQSDGGRWGRAAALGALW